VLEHRSDERAATADIEVALNLVLQPADRIRVVRPDELRVPPRRSRERLGDDVLDRVVEERRPRIVFDGPPRPRRLEHLISGTPKQYTLTTLRDGADGLSHIGEEAVVERPRRCVDH